MFKKELEKLGEEYNTNQTVESFLFRYIFEFFGLERYVKNEFDCKNLNEFLSQKHHSLFDLTIILEEIKPLMSFLYKLVNNYEIRKKIKSFPEDSIIKMIENFFTLKRTGRNRKISESDLKKLDILFKKFKNVFNFINDVKKVKTYKESYKIKVKYDIKKEDLTEVLEDLEFKSLVKKAKKCSRATLYRYDKRLIKLKKIDFFIRFSEMGNLFKIYKIIEGQKNE